MWPLIALASLSLLDGFVQQQYAVHQPPAESSARHFTVRESIEMARFERNDSEPKFSPDKKYFVVVTSRGLLRSDEIESTLWLFRSSRVSELLLRDQPRNQCLPKVLARVTAIPQLEYPDSYESLITDVRWRPDSKSVMFLGQDSQAKRQLFQADVISGKVRVLTSGNYNVTRFELADHIIAYGAMPPNTNRRAGSAINSEASDVTGVPLSSILFPQMVSFVEPSDFWVIDAGKVHRLIDPNTHEPILLPNLPPAPYSVLSLSSDGQIAVLLMPSKSIPSSWESYEPALAYLRLQSKGYNMAADFWPTQYAAVDLKSGKTTVLVNAPNAWSLGSADMNQAVWSSDRKKLLLTNTYLALDGTDQAEKSRRIRYCVAAVAELASREVGCVVFTNYDRARKHLIAGSFGENDNEVVLRFWNAPNTRTKELYHYENAGWRLADLATIKEEETVKVKEHAADSVTFSLAVKQDLNTPPALWATRREITPGKKIWDPNPQLASFDMGEASEFHWKDKTGYEWRGALVKPPDYISGKRYPLVIQTHGFQANEFITDGAYTTAFAARPLASAGIVVLQMPTRHDHLVTQDEASEQIEGFESAIETLANNGLIDRSKVGIIGFSRTCYYVESALIRYPRRFLAATLADGVDESYMQYLLFGVGRSQDEERQIYGSTPFGNGLKRWLEHAPGFNLDAVQTPLRIEAIAPASVLEEWEIYASLFKQEKAVDLIYFPNEQHILQKPLARLASQQGNVDWFRFWLKGEEDPDPAKVRQYALWKQLRDHGAVQN